MIKDSKDAENEIALESNSEKEFRSGACESGHSGYNPRFCTRNSLGDIWLGVQELNKF